MIEKKVLKNIKSFVPENKKDSILIGVSGGVDSVFLVDVISKLNEYYNLFNKVTLIYINYVFNPNSYDRLNLCKKISKKYKYPLIIKKSNLNKKNFESIARKQRYQIFTDVLNNKGIDYVLTAHHKDDQIETLLMKHYDKSDWISFLGIRNKYRKIIRPLLSIYKNEIISYSSDNNLSWIEDPTNYDNSFRRNKIRNVDLPKIKKTNRGLIKSLITSHNRAKSNLKKFLLNFDSYKKIYINKVSGDYLLVSNKILELEDFGYFKLFYKNLISTNFNLNKVNTNRFWISFCDFLRFSKTGSQFYLDEKICVLKDRDNHYIFKTELKNVKKHIKICPNFKYNDWYDTKIVLDKKNLLSNSNVIGEFEIPTKKIIKGLYVRNWQNGDKCYKSSKKIKDIFINNKISSFEKSRYPIITDSKNQVLCVPNLYNYFSKDKNISKIYWLKK